ncbi:HAD-IIIC family phosphatase [Sphingomonas bacterium]|uniref:HAD-IIIC family phosphatase n=1 Tax=Sphingomonas bacterium TaxID=1895847 RepID=UPI0015759105|nr:HAD-IIIC family phosphatase [Sphingomonas bacterium]
MGDALDATNLLPWLPAPEADFRATVRALATAEAPGEADLRRIAATAMDASQLGQLGRVVRRNREAVARNTSFLPVRLGIVGSHTLDQIIDALEGTGLRHGLLLKLTKAPYGQVIQAVLDPASGFAPHSLDYVLLSLDARSLGLHQSRLDEGGAGDAVQAAIDQMILLRDGIRDRIGAACIFQTLAPPTDTLFGHFDRRVAGSPRALVEAFNRRLDTIALDGDVIVDVAFVASTVGLARWNDAREWHGAKMPFALDATPLYADHVCRVIAAARGKARKCLILDLDNTLWGGVIGDDGVEGIALGNGSGTGEAFAAIQRLALELRQRGVILAVCSKNEEANALIPFREHAEMLLKEEHIAAFVANWNDKAGNIRDIAATLNIGTDSLVFLDDNPVERALVRRELPEVAVPEAGLDPADYPGLVARAGYFEAVSFSDEDRKRADYYAANAERTRTQASITNLADYLASLDMVMTVQPFDGQSRARISQLVNKSNQFNLTTRRYGEDDIQAFERDPRKYTLQVRLEDRFGDNGMISVIIFDKHGDAWSCDTWLMSCRVLGRGVEQAVLAEIAAAARAEGAAALIGHYLPTKKNGLVAEHFAKLGFAQIAGHADGATDWRLDLADYSAPDLPIRVVRIAEAEAVA